jgi:2-polyprenyl-3-methyl-5-hydroxy-6-metoxy-1,4-benzoquinol methylase
VITTLSPETGCFICSHLVGCRLQKDGYSHFLCKNCGHTEVRPMPEKKVLIDLYEEQYQYSNQKRLGLKFKNPYRWINTFDENKKIKILDVGCADGQFLDFVKRNGFTELFGIELNKRLFNEAIQKGHKVVNGDLMEDFFKSQQFELINVGDVIEHVQDPFELVSKLKRMLTPNGKIVITTPDVASLWSKVTLRIHKATGIPWSSLTPPHHVHNFSHKSLCLLLASSGLNVISEHSYSHNLVYELGQLHLKRKFTHSKSVMDFFRLVFGYLSYLVAHILCLCITIFVGRKFKMTLIAKPDLSTTALKQTLVI